MDNIYEFNLNRSSMKRLEKQVNVVDAHTLHCVLEETVENWINHYLDNGMMTMPEQWQDTAASDLATCLVCELKIAGLKEANYDL